MTAKVKKKQKVSKNQEQKKPLTEQLSEKKQNAVQKINALEQKILELSKVVNTNSQVLAEEIDAVKRNIGSIVHRLNAAIKAAEDGDLTSASVNAIIIQQNVEDLKTKVAYLENQGLLSRNDDAEITDKTFVVAREIDDEGNEVNPRVQFAVGTLSQEIKDLLLGKKIGDLIKPEESELTIEILGVYDIKEVKVQKNFEEEEAPKKEDKA